jgi:hypothetical protein
MDSMKPDKEQALQFAVMLQAGLPAHEAIRYFCSNEDEVQLAYMLKDWQKSPLVARAMQTLMGKTWQEMTLDERIAHALDLHYSGLAYFLFSNNYSDLQGSDKLKADTARQALEARQAGTAGKSDALSQFFADINSGKVKLAKPVQVVQNVEKVFN